MEGKSTKSGWPFTQFVLVVALLLAGCPSLPDDEATWVLEDLAARFEDSRLKRSTPKPVRRSAVYVEDSRNFLADLYLPGEPALAGIVLVPGAAAKGKNDPRLVAFATTLARTRFLVLVPDLPNLRALKVRAEDAASIAAAYRHLRSRPELPGNARAGIGAFSYAVGPAVLAAMEPDLRARVDFVLGVGGYHDLNRVVNFFTTGYFVKDAQWAYLQPNVYGKWVFVLSNTDRFSDARDRKTLRKMAERKLKDPSASVADLRGNLTEEGRSLVDLLENRDRDRTPELIAGLPAEIRAEMEALNLANKDLSRLQARLILLHGRDDNIIPYTESVALAAAVPPGQSDLFVIDGLAHVDTRPVGLDRHATWRAIHAILAQRLDPGVVQ
ncbi:MAG: alpha/beta hydrolase [Betaproteobacteria bacterium]|nr:MAG: alpha/beta hydrolase [Betaproteobacteria bacterium]